jgi:hypothetical protein
MQNWVVSGMMAGARVAQRAWKSLCAGALLSRADQWLRIVGRRPDGASIPVSSCPVLSNLAAPNTHVKRGDDVIITNVGLPEDAHLVGDGCEVCVESHATNSFRSCQLHAKAQVLLMSNTIVHDSL